MVRFRASLPEKRAKLARLPGPGQERRRSYAFRNYLHNDNLYKILKSFVRGELKGPFEPFNFTRFTIHQIQTHFRSESLRTQPVMFISRWNSHPFKPTPDYSQCYNHQDHNHLSSFTWRQINRRTITNLSSGKVKGSVNKYRLFIADTLQGGGEERRGLYVLYEYKLVSGKYPDNPPPERSLKISPWALFVLAEEDPDPEAAAEEEED